jgi:hypothetical protein
VANRHHGKVADRSVHATRDSSRGKDFYSTKGLL